MPSITHVCALKHTGSGEDRQLTTNPHTAATAMQSPRHAMAQFDVPKIVFMPIPKASQTNGSALRCTALTISLCAAVTVYNSVG